MSKHILDHADPKGEGTRVEKFTEIDRKDGKDGPSGAAKSLYKRPRQRPDAERRTEEYVRIERDESS